MGISMLYSALQLRWWERSRLFWKYWFNMDETKELFPYRTPVQGVHAEATWASEDGSVRVLVSPSTAATSSLHVSLLTLPPGRELPSTTAAGVEFYYVVSCASEGATFSQQGVIETSQLKPGDCFVVDAGSMRWISNAAAKAEPLVLLRATDGGERYSQAGMDRIRMDPNRSKNYYENAMKRLSAGFTQVKNMAKEFSFQSLEKTTGNR
jgi:mannose-6-phosphate isomerase-like protein (cupin superfamily)